MPLQTENPRAESNAAIIHASKNGHHMVVKLLLDDERAEPSAGGNYTIKIAASKGHHMVVQ